jgi:leader peptidase (prepilin peptidase)/N-methyltransferase
MTVWIALLLAYVAVVTVPLVVVDARAHRLPNAWVLPGYAVALIAWVGTALSSGAVPWVSLVSAAGYFGGMLLLSLLGGMGMGDVKLAGVLGAAAGLLSPLAGLLAPILAFVLGGGAGLALMGSGWVARRWVAPGSLVAQLSWRSRIPFGPFMLAGFWLAVVLVGVMPAVPATS